MTLCANASGEWRSSMKVMSCLACTLGSTVCRKRHAPRPVDAVIRERHGGGRAEAGVLATDGAAWASVHQRVLAAAAAAAGADAPVHLTGRRAVARVV